jgi:hypothetical protein
MVPYAVWPQLLLMSNGALVLGSGRPGIVRAPPARPPARLVGCLAGWPCDSLRRAAVPQGFWVSAGGSGDGDWVGYDVEVEHSKLLPSDPWDAAYGTGTTSYTGIAEVEPGVALLAYDKTSGAGRAGAVQKVYSMRITVAPAQ